MVERRFGLGAIICIFNKDFSKILLLNRNEEKRKMCGADWGNIGGRVELGERLIEACLREAREEIGVNLNPEAVKMIDIIEKPFRSEIFHAIHFIYAAILDEDEKITLNNESDGYKWFNLTELPDKTIDAKEYLVKLSIEAKKRLVEEKV